MNPDVLQYFNGGNKIANLERVIHNKKLSNQVSQLFDGTGDNPGAWENCFHALAARAESPDKKSLWSSTFCAIDDIIESYPNKPIDTNWLARKFCMSKFYFIREFKKAKGVTPQAYIMLYRLGKAKKMLLDDAPFTDIAYLNGFCDPSHFTNSFKKYFGISPSRYVNS